MKKFKNIYIGILSTALIALGSCNKRLDLKPYQQIEQNNAILTAQDVQITLVGAYNRAGLAGLYGGGAFLYPDLMSTQIYVDWQGTFQGLTQMVGQSIPVDNSFVNTTWADGYQVINQANNVLANLSKVSSGNAARTEGEAKFLRGLTYFDLVRLFGKDFTDGDANTNLGVPIVLTPTTVITPASYVARATVAAVYQQAIADLSDAESKLPASNSFYANKYSASAILARLYLQKGDYANAAAEATKVIASGKFQLNAAYADEFPYPGGTAGHVDNTPEDIFAIQVTGQQGTNALNTYYASADNAGRGDIIVKDSFLNNFEAGDDRLSVYNPDSDGILRCDKFDNTNGNVHVIRLAEMYLIRAEANFRTGAATTPGNSPADDINKIRERAQLDDLATITLDDILNERKLELAFEGGFFLYDAKRLKQTVGAQPYSSNKLVFPIPLQDINANPKLVQNPGYN